MPSSYTLGAHFEGFVRQMVESGRYASASEVMRDGLRLMEEREAMRDAKLQTLRASIQDGLDSGDATTLDMQDVKVRARARRAGTQP